ncbi:hypothetical protein ACFQ4Q_12430 [Lysobacter gummosus]|uniref:hypothetical protein n=2 Tax=Lysobacter gummosus TaxID=262324 RepID=UPI00362F2C59
MASKATLNSVKPRVRGLLALALATVLLSLAVTVLRKPERDGWIALPPQPMDASDPDIRQLLTKSEMLTPRQHVGEAPADASLAQRCGEEDAEAEIVPAGHPAAAPVTDWVSPGAPSPPPLPDERYIMVIAGAPTGPSHTRRVQIDIDGDRARVLISNGDWRHAGTTPGSAADIRSEQRLSLSALAPLREAWQVPELWSANQRSGVWCAGHNGLREAFFEACVHGRYYARDRACDRNAQEPLAQLWKRVVELTPSSKPAH